MLTAQGHQRFRQTDEADGQGAVLEHLPDGIRPAQLFGVDPHALAHQEGEVVDLLVGDDLQPLQQLIVHQIAQAFQFFEEPADVALGLDGDAGQVDGGEAQVAAAGADFPGGIIHIADDAGAAAHVGNFGLGMAFFVILLVEGRVHKAEVGEQALGAGADGQPVQVVVGVAGVEADALLHAEDLDGENRRFAVAQTGLGGQHHVAHHHAALGGGVHAVVDGGEGHLRAGTAVHGVQVVDQGFHGLIGGLVGLLLRVLPDEGNDLVQLVLRSAGQKLRHLFRHQTIHVRIGGQRNLFAQLVYDSAGLIRGILHAAQQFQRPIQIVPETLAVGLLDAGGHAVIEIHDALAAVLVVLVGLNGDAGQRGIAVDVVGLPQHAVTGGEAAVEQIQQVDLAAGGGQGVEVQVVDMDIPVMMGSRKTGVQHVHFIELLRAFAAELEHTAHGGIAVDVGVFALDVAVHRVLAGDVLEHLHQAGVHLTHTAAFGAV